MTLSKIRIAEIIGVFLLLISTSVFLTWFFLFERYNKIFETLGFYVILVLTLLFLIGIALLIWDRINWKDHQRIKNWNRAFSVLLINVPMCLLLIFLWDFIGKRVLLTVENLSRTTIKTIIISGTDYQNNKIERIQTNVKTNERARFIIDKWVCHKFQVKVVYPDTVIRDHIEYHRLFRGQPLLDTLKINPDYSIKISRGEERIFEQRRKTAFK